MSGEEKKFVRRVTLRGTKRLAREIEKRVGPPRRTGNAAAGERRVAGADRVAEQKVFWRHEEREARPGPVALPLGRVGKTRGEGEERIETITYERTRAKQTRAVPAEAFAQLPVAETIEIVPEAVKAGPELYERIGEERTFEVDIIEPKLVKREIVRPKYRHKLDRTLAPLVAAAPARVITGGYASAGLLAWIAISKYVHHLPLYRLEQMSQRWGAQISRQSMSDWIEVTAAWLAPIYRHMHRGLLAGGYIQADETPVRCNDPDENGAGQRKEYLWVISRQGADVVFDWRLSRRHGELTSLLTGFQGVLQSDGYEAYPSYVRSHAGVTWVGCWAHARRYFVEGMGERQGRAVGTALDRPALSARSRVGSGERR